MVTRNFSLNSYLPPISWLCVFVEGSGMSVLLKEFSFVTPQANKVNLLMPLTAKSVECVCLECFHIIVSLYVCARALKYPVKQSVSYLIHWFKTKSVHLEVLALCPTKLYAALHISAQHLNSRVQMHPPWIFQKC